MEIEDTADCYADGLILYDGMERDADILLWDCGNSTSSVVSSGSSIVVQFYSDYSISDGYFSLSWTFEDQDEGGGWPEPGRFSA